MDGTSPMYVCPPVPESDIGKCVTCKAQIKCSIDDTVNDAAKRGYDGGK